MENIIEKYISELNTQYETSFELKETTASHYEIAIENYTLFLRQHDDNIYISIPVYKVEGENTLEYIEMLGSAQYLDMGTDGMTIYFDEDKNTLLLSTYFSKYDTVENLYLKIESIVNAYVFLHEEIEKKRTLLMQ